MSGEYGSDFISIIDEEGNEFELEHLDTIQVDDTLYMAFLPADADEDDDESLEMIILKVLEEDGEDILATIDDEGELEHVYQKFMEQLFEDEVE